MKSNPYRMLWVLGISLIAGLQPTQAHLTADGSYTRPGTKIRIRLNMDTVHLTPSELERIDFDLDLLPAKDLKSLEEIQMINSPTPRRQGFHALSTHVIALQVLGGPVEELSKFDSDIPGVIGAHVFFNLSSEERDEWRRLDPEPLLSGPLSDLDLADDLGHWYSNWASDTDSTFTNEVKLRRSLFLGIDMFVAARFVKHGNIVAIFNSHPDDPFIEPQRTGVSISRSDHWLTVGSVTLRLDGGMIVGTLDDSGNLIRFDHSVPLPKNLQDAVPLSPDPKNLPLLATMDLNASRTIDRIEPGVVELLSLMAPNQNYRSPLDRQKHLLPETRRLGEAASDSHDVTLR